MKLTKANNISEMIGYQIEVIGHSAEVKPEFLYSVLQEIEGV